MTVAATLFDFAAEVVRAHHRSPQGRVTVVPVVLSDLATARPVLQALCEVMQGRLLDTADPGQRDLSTPVPGTTDPVRRIAVTTALVAETGRCIVLRDVGDGLVDAELNNPPIGADPSPAEQTLTAVARAAAHRDLDNYEFVAITYDTGPIDLSFRKPVWQLLVNQFGGMPSTTLRTLLVVTEAAIDIDLHCQTAQGFRFAIEEDRLLHRQGRDNLMANVGQVARHPRPLVLFLGAGFAVSSRLPDGDRVRDGAIRRLLDVPEGESPISSELASRFHSWLSEKPGWLSESETSMSEEVFVRGLTLERVVRAEQRMYPELPTLQEFLQHHDAVIGTPGAAVRGLSAVLQRGVGRVVVVEVNFDLLVETHTPVALKVFASETEFAGAADYINRYLNGAESDVPLLKVHGTIAAFETCVVSEEQTERGVGAGKLEAMRALLADPPRLCVYVGLSMRDRDITGVLGGEDFARSLDEFWVSPYLVPSVARFAEKRTSFWKGTTAPTIEDRLVTETADAYFSALADVWAG